MEVKKIISAFFVAAIVLSSAFGFSILANTGLAGDCYEDGKLDTKDVLVLKKYLAKYDLTNDEKFNYDNCDYNNDGKVNVSDLLLLQIFLVNQSQTTTTTTTATTVTSTTTSTTATSAVTSTTSTTETTSTTTTTTTTTSTTKAPTIASSTTTKSTEPTTTEDLYSNTY